MQSCLYHSSLDASGDQQKGVPAPMSETSEEAGAEAGKNAAGGDQLAAGGTGEREKSLEAAEQSQPLGRIGKKGPDEKLQLLPLRS